MPQCRPYTGVNEGDSNQWIYRDPFVKSLGFYVDGNLDWGKHVHHVIEKVSSGIAILKSSRNYLLQRTLNSKLYMSLIDRHFYYGNIVWYVKGMSWTIPRFRPKRSI